MQSAYWYVSRGMWSQGPADGEVTNAAAAEASTPTAAADRARSTRRRRMALQSTIVTLSNVSQRSVHGVDLSVAEPPTRFGRRLLRARPAGQHTDGLVTDLPTVTVRARQCTTSRPHRSRSPGMSGSSSTSLVGISRGGVLRRWGRTVRPTSSPSRTKRATTTRRRACGSTSRARPRPTARRDRRVSPPTAAIVRSIAEA